MRLKHQVLHFLRNLRSPYSWALSSRSVTLDHTLLSKPYSPPPTMMSHTHIAHMRSYVPSQYSPHNYPGLVHNTRPYTACGSPCLLELAGNLRHTDFSHIFKTQSCRTVRFRYTLCTGTLPVHSILNRVECISRTRRGCSLAPTSPHRRYSPQLFRYEHYRHTSGSHLRVDQFTQ
jgi:hypothetical protein